MHIFFWYTDQLHLEIIVIHQGIICLSKIEEDMKGIVTQQEFIMNEHLYIERYLLNQLQRPQQQLQSQAIFSQHNLQTTPTSTRHHQ